MTVEFEIITPVGAVLLTTPDMAVAREFVRERMKKAPGLILRIEEVQRVEYRRVVYRPKPASVSNVTPLRRIA